MKNFFLGVLTSVIFLCTVAATVPNSLVTFKPAKPKHTVVYRGLDPTEFIIKYANQGYIVTNTVGNQSYTTLVMCRYD